MKYSILFMLIVLCFGACSQGKQALQTSNEELRQKLKMTHLKLENKQRELQQAYEKQERLENEITTLKTLKQETNLVTPVKTQTAKTDKKGHHPEAHRCKAITKAGRQCSRNAKAESDYCWQHQKKAIPPTPTSSFKLDGHTVYTGSRGGQYYINKNGKKTYIKRKE